MKNYKSLRQLGKDNSVMKSLGLPIINFNLIYEDENYHKGYLKKKPRSIKKRKREKK